MLMYGATQPPTKLRQAVSIVLMIGLYLMIFPILSDAGAYEESIAEARQNICQLEARVAIFIAQRRDAGMSPSQTERLTRHFVNEHPLPDGDIPLALAGKNLKKAVAVAYTKAGRSCSANEWGGVATLQCFSSNYKSCARHATSYLQIDTCRAAWAGGMEGTSSMMAWTEAAKCFEQRP